MSRWLHDSLHFECSLNSTEFYSLFINPHCHSFNTRIQLRRSRMCKMALRSASIYQLTKDRTLITAHFGVGKITDNEKKF